MTKTQTQIAIVSISLAVAIVGFFTLHMADAKNDEIAVLRSTQAEYEKKIISLKPEHELFSKKIEAIEKEANFYRGKIQEINDNIDAKINPKETKEDVFQKDVR